MGTVLLVLHLLAAIFLVVLILMQRSGGGALSGLGGGNGASSFLSARGKGNLLTRLTAIFAVIFFATSIALSIYHKGSDTKSVSLLDAVPVASTIPAADINVPVVAEAPAEETTAAEAPSAPEAPVAEAPEVPAAE